MVPTTFRVLVTRRPRYGCRSCESAIVQAPAPARIVEGGHVRQSSAQRHFCGKCGTALWLWDPTWPELVHPHAGAIDTPLPTPPANVHILLDSKAAWVTVEGHPGDQRFDGYPDISLKEWHQRNV